MSQQKSSASPDNGLPIKFNCHANARNDIEAIFRYEDYPLNRIRFVDGGAIGAIIDIGAHCGAFSFLCAYVYPQALIRGFEPLRINCDMAVRNMHSFPQVEIRHCGLSDYDGQTDIFYSPAFGFAASSSVRTRDHVDEHETVSIRRASAQLADLPEIAILKIDTEGHEFRILCNLISRLAAISFVFLEIHSDTDRRQIDHLLQENFTLFYSRTDMVNRYKVSYVNRRHLLEGRIQVQTAPELRP